MSRRVRMLCLLPGVLLALQAGCGVETYPPAVPVTTDQTPGVPWGAPAQCYVEPQALKDLATTALGPAQVPGESEWPLWRISQSTSGQTCTGKGKQRRCKPTAVTAVDQANSAAVVRPTIANTELGTSGRIRYDYDLRGNKIYKITTSPTETTWLTLPETLKLAADLLLDKNMWEVAYTVVGEGEHRQHLIAIRPIYTELKTRAVIQIQNGPAIQLDIESQERPGMLRVSWIMPEQAIPPPLPSPDQLPPVFDSRHAYDQYALKVESKHGQPAWMPLAVIDDGKVTLIRLPNAMDGIRAPIASGIQQNGQPALVSTRLYMRPEHGAWLYVQGLWPAIELRDAAGITVRAVRQVPPPPSPKENGYDPTSARQMDPRRALSPAAWDPRRPIQ